jgi:hypothetical protein
MSTAEIDESSVEVAAGDDTCCCACCGIAAVDDIKLKKCTACKQVRYCSVECQKYHRPKHKRECKKRAAEIRDKILFKLPESTHLGDCPICLIPLPLEERKYGMKTCCSKIVCNGCIYANATREIKERLKHACPFCRCPMATSKAEDDVNFMKRLEVNDPLTMCQMGKERYLEGDYSGAFEYWSKSAGLGDADAHYELSVMYRQGEVVEKDKKKELHHLEVAAIGGHLYARYNLGWEEWNNGRTERAMKHFIIAASNGHEDSAGVLRNYGYLKGHISKEEFAATLRAYQAAVDATKSPQRVAAEEARHSGDFIYGKEAHRDSNSNNKP